MVAIGFSASLDAAISQQVRGAFDRLANTSVKLATLKRIVSSGDDAAGLVAATELSRQITAMEAAANSADRARGFVAATDSGLDQAADLLQQIDANLVAAADSTLSDDQRAALQAEVNAAIEALDRIGASDYRGQPLYDGSTKTFAIDPELEHPASLETLKLSSGSLGDGSGTLADLKSGGSANLASGNLEAAQEIIAAARSDILTARAQAGAFERTTLNTATAVLADSTVNMQQALSSIADADVARESAALARDMVLSQAAVATAKLASRTQRAAAELLFSTLG